MRQSVLVVDDHDGFRSEARAILEGDGIDVVGEAACGAAAVAETARLRPSLVLLDVGLPDASGIELVGRMRELSPGAIVVLISGRRESEYGDRVASSGADAFLEKNRLAPGVIPTLLAGLGTR
jgi:DNA-binding NarL/FixJ family response regulator